VSEKRREGKKRRIALPLPPPPEKMRKETCLRSEFEYSARYFTLIRNIITLINELESTTIR
jgi:hypothetical protein